MVLISTHNLCIGAKIKKLTPLTIECTTCIEVVGLVAHVLHANLCLTWGHTLDYASHYTDYCKSGNVRENLIFANIREFVASRK